MKRAKQPGVNSTKQGPTDVPPILRQIPKVVIRALDVPQVLHSALISQNHGDKQALVIAMYSLHSYFRSANRIERRLRRAKKAVGIARIPRIENLFADAHFYLICWARIAKLTGFIRTNTRFRRTGRVRRRHDRVFKARIDFRDHLEHFEERLLGQRNPPKQRRGGRKFRKLTNPNHLFNMSNDVVTFGGQELDVGPKSTQLLTTIITEFDEAVLFDSLEVLEKTDLTLLKNLIRSAAREVQTQRFLKRFSPV